jgi:hypothetical protein
MRRARIASCLRADGVADLESARAALPAQGSRAVASARLTVLLTLASVSLGCRFFSAGMPTGAASDSGSGRDVLESTSTDETIDASSRRGDGTQLGDAVPAYGEPRLVGCSDGTREGFRDIKTWPRIAACAGGWRVPGLLSESARAPQCLRRSGNDSANVDGRGCVDNACVDCSASDLCAPLWHACLNGPEVADCSPTGCEGMLSPGDEAFFVVMTGASSQGVCYPEGKNDLHGCGNLGAPESDQCPPLTRRMSFTECNGTGTWECGNANRNLIEAETVRKVNSSLGGVLCCRDD